MAGWVSFIAYRLSRHGLPPGDEQHTEVFIDVEDENGCSYYLVNSNMKTIFWLDPISSDVLGLLPVVSHSHMITQLEMQYWTHVEIFCKHRAWIKPEDVEELIQIFQHGLCGMFFAKDVRVVIAS